MLDTRYRPFLTDLSSSPMTKENNFIRGIEQKYEKVKEKHGPITVNCSFPTAVDAFATDFDFFRSH